MVGWFTRPPARRRRVICITIAAHRTRLATIVSVRTILRDLFETAAAMCGTRRCARRYLVIDRHAIGDYHTVNVLAWRRTQRSHDRIRPIGFFRKERLSSPPPNTTINGINIHKRRVYPRRGILVLMLYRLSSRVKFYVLRPRNKIK